MSLPTHVSAVKVPGFELVELIHESGSRVIYRAVRDSDGEQVILKTLNTEYPRKQDVTEIHREFQIANRLKISGVIRVYSLLTYGAGNLAIEMESHGISLADFMAARQNQPLELEQFFAIAVRLAWILGQLHEQELVHKDIVPRNVLIDTVSGELRLIDFGIASELSRERQGIAMSNRLEGSLPYISPEQTGRMNRDVDYRSDYYSLGVTFFELLTGKLPFSAENALEWVHRHISQPPPAAHEINHKLPEPLSRIVLKLMSKNAEDRYQSSYGLVVDLERCRNEFSLSGKIQYFDLGTADISRRFQIPQRLYGREGELNQLDALFEKVLNGTTQLCLVSGYSGVGKSLLINEFGKSAVRNYGYLIQGKFDQFHQSTPYSAVAKAFSGLMQELLGEPKACLDAWRNALLEALGQNGQVIIDLVPELEIIIGKQTVVPELPPTEAQNRFQMVFLSLVKVFATQQNPLVIFIDDLQWSDVPTLNLIQRLVTARDLKHLFIIGAYRSNAVDIRHPLSLTLNQIQKSHEYTELSLQPLEHSSVDRLIADTLHLDAQRCKPLSAIIYEKANGNPFFINELLKSLHEDGAITFNPEEGRWGWNLTAVQDAKVGDNVVDFLVTGLRRLNGSTQQVMQLAACIGNSFDLQTLSVIYGQSMQQTGAALHEALRRNMVLPLSESYKFIGMLEVNDEDKNTSESNIDNDGSLNPRYKFQHDRVQQAAYALIDADSKQAVHLSVGRLLLQHSSVQVREERLIEIVEHMNAGRALMADPIEQRELACMNLEAGLKAQRSSAYQSALGFLQIGQALLGDDAWKKEYELMLALSREIQQCTYLTADYAASDAWAETIMAQARSALAKAEILSARTRQYSTTGKMRESMQAALSGLSLLGVDLIDQPDADDIAAEIAAVETNLNGRSIADLIDAPAVTEVESQVAIRLLMEVFPAAFLSGSGNIFPYLVLKSVNLSLRDGSSPESAFAYAAYGMLLCGVLDNPALGYQYGKLGVDMNERFNDIRLKSRIIYLYAMFVHHWSHHWSSMTPWFLKGIEAGYQSGDLLYLAFSAQDCIIWDPKLELSVASREQRSYLEIVRDCEYRDSLDSGTLFLQMQLNFQGLTDGMYSMNDASFNEASCVENMNQRHFMTGIANHHIYKAEIHFLYNDYRGALPHVEAMDKMIASAMSLPQLVRFCIVAFLTRAALFREMDQVEQQATQLRLQADLAQMNKWVNVCPDNFRHLSLTMQAELARLANAIPEALGLYEQAIAAARVSGFQRDEAQANELAAKCLLSLGLTKAADGYLAAACYLYDRWGALRKVGQMETQYPQLLRVKVSEGAVSATTRGGGSRTMDASAIDMNSVIKSTQAISSEIKLSALLHTLMSIIIENAGAEKGYFIRVDQDQLLMEAEATIDESDMSILGGIPLDDTKVAASIVHYVVRTGDSVVLNEACSDARFGNDPYVIKEQPISVLCAPVIQQGRVIGIIYLENNLASGVFTPQRLEMLKMLSSQAAISLENAWLYANLEQRVKERTNELKTALGELEVAHETVHSSIQYASRIQRAILPPEDHFSRFVPDHFVLWEPRDVVGGDIYWCKAWGEGCLIILGDCTGHGVPGAFMTMLSAGALERALGYVSPGDVSGLLSRMHGILQNTLNQGGEHGQSDDGIEMGVCYLNADQTKILFAGARFDLYILEKGEVKIIKGSKSGMGYRGILFDQQFETKEILPNKDMTFYLASDGVVDQIGAETGWGVGRKRMMQWMLEAGHLPLVEQKRDIYHKFLAYQGSALRRDDVSIIGFKV